MTEPLTCAVCERSYGGVPGLVLARWRDQDICTWCLEDRPGREDAEAEAAGDRPFLTQQAHRHQGGAGCVYCGNAYFSVWRTTGQSASVYQLCRCHACGQDWTNVYRLGGYIREDGVHNAADLDAIAEVMAVDTRTSPAGEARA